MSLGEGFLAERWDLAFKHSSILHILEAYIENREGIYRAEVFTISTSLNTLIIIGTCCNFDANIEGDSNIVVRFPAAPSVYGDLIFFRHRRNEYYANGTLATKMLALIYRMREAMKNSHIILLLATTNQTDILCNHCFDERDSCFEIIGATATTGDVWWPFL